MNPYERLVVVGNPHSSDAGAIHRDVNLRLASEGFRPVGVDLPSPIIDDVTEEFHSRLRSGDRVLVAGGDGTYYLAVNALRQLTELRKNIDVGFLAFGNRCDAANFSGRYRQHAVAMAGNQVLPRSFRPLRHRLHGQDPGNPLLDRVAVGYVTFGDALAPGADLMNTDQNRRRMKNSSIKLLLSARIAAGYLARRVGRFGVLPEGTCLNGEVLGPDTTDIIALQSLTMAGVLRNRHTDYDEESFESLTLSGNTIHRLSPTILRGPTRGIPSTSVNTMRVELPGPATIALQSDGEAMAIDGVTTIQVDKPATESLHVLMPGQLPKERA